MYGSSSQDRRQQAVVRRGSFIFLHGVPSEQSDASSAAPDDAHATLTQASADRLTQEVQYRPVQSSGSLQSPNASAMTLEEIHTTYPSSDDENDDAGHHGETSLPIARWRAAVLRVLSAHRWTVIFCVSIVFALFLTAIFFDAPKHRVHTEPVKFKDVRHWALKKARCSGEGSPLRIVYVPDAVNCTADARKEVDLSNLQESAENPCIMLECKKHRLNWKSWATVAITIIALILMVLNMPPDVTLLGANIMLLLIGVIDGEEAWEGFSNAGVLSVAVLFVVARALEEVGTVERLLRPVLGRPRSLGMALLRLCVPVACISAFMNNTPVVAMMIPILEGWSNRIGFHKSRFMMPLSFASMLGGMCSLLGTSTNLVLQGLLIKHDPKHKFSMFEIAPVGVPCMLVGILFLCFATNLLLPKVDENAASDDAVASETALKSQRLYSVTFELAADSSLVGETLTSSGVLVVPGSTLHGIVRNGAPVPLLLSEMMPIEDHESDRESQDSTASQRRTHSYSTDSALLTPDTCILQAGDRLLLSGVADSIVKLRQLPGFKAVSHGVSQLGARRSRRRLVEVVLARSCPLVGCTIAEAEDTVYEKYEAGIVALRIVQEVREPSSLQHDMHESLLASRHSDDGLRGHEKLMAGDALLLEVFPNFIDVYRHDSQFALVRVLRGSKPPRSGNAMDRFRFGFSIFVLLMMVVLSAMDVLELLTAAVTAAALLVATKCITVEEAFRSVKFRTILAIVTAFGIGTAMQNTGVAEAVADALVDVSKSFGKTGVLASISLVTALIGCVVSNNAVVVLLFPICVSLSTQLEVVELKELLCVLMIGASSSFLTPISYQTNLMVLRPGNYAFTDFTRLGGPLQLIIMVCSIALAPLVFGK